MISNPYERLLWGVAITLLIICGIFYVNRAKKLETFNEKIIMVGFACLIFSICVARIFRFLAELQLEGTYVNHTFYGDLTNTSSNLSWVLLFKLRCVSMAMGYAFFSFTYELIEKRTKFLITIENISWIVLVIIIPPIDLFFIIHDIFWMVNIMVVSLIFVQFTKWADFELKAVSSIILLGIQFLFIGSVLTGVVKEYNIIPLIIAPIVTILGTILISIPLIINPKYFSHALKFWVVNSILIITIGCSMTIFFIIFEPEGYALIISIIMTLTGSYIIYRTIKMLKSDRITGNKKAIKEKKPDILGMFIKPQMITEEEVSVSKEKKICLVCKGKVRKFNSFICDCDTIYCEKCARTLSDLENMCWVCDTPFDESKPVKPYKKEEEIPSTIVEGKIQKS